MKRRVVVRCCLVSLLLAAPAPLLIILLFSLVTGVADEQLLAVIQDHQLIKAYVAIAAAVFVLLLVATLTVNALAPRRRATAFAEAEDDDREVGEVKWFNVNKGYGFITRDDGDDVFVHFRAIRGRGHRTLVEGQKVRYYVVENDRGLQADDVTIIS